MTKSSFTSEEKELIRAYKIVAEVVRLYGDIYLPIFERLHLEIQVLKQRDNLRSLAGKISQETDID